jgi:hypothetical protein
MSKIILEQRPSIGIIRSQTMELQKERFVTILVDCQLYLIFYFILGFYL